MREQESMGRGRPRVAVITHYFPSSCERWAGHSAYQTLRILAGRMEVKVFYPEVGYPKALTPKTNLGAADPAWEPGGVGVEYIRYGALPVISRPVNGWSAARALYPRVRAFGPDVILNYVIYPDGLAALEVGRRLGVPVAVTSIGSDLNRISDPICGALTRRVLREADAVITVSGDLLQTARRMGADAGRSRAIVNGCDTGVFRPRDRRTSREQLGIGLEGPVVVYVGRLDVRKGLRELVEAAVMLRRSAGDLRCYLVGYGPDKGVLEEAIARHGAAEWLRLMPAAATEGVAQWMGAADVVTLPSYMEGCPNVVLEALAAGRPVVATRVGGIPEMLDEASGALVPAMDAGALAGALGEVLGRRWDGAEIAARNSRSWADVADDVEGVLRGLVKGRMTGSAA